MEPEEMTPTSEISLVAPILYLTEGFFIIAFNSLLLCYLFLSARTRFQLHYQVLAGCIAFDVIFGAAYFSTGVYHIPSTSYLYCLNTLHNWLILFITPEAGILSLFVALDRAISVFYPMKYIKLPRYYPLILYTTSFLLVIPAYIVSYIGVYPSRDLLQVTAKCELRQAIPEEVYQALRWVRISTTMIAVTLYLPIGYRITKLIKNAYKCTQRNEEAEKIRQMTLTIGLITLNQLVFFAIPDLYLVFVASNTTSFLYILNMNKGVINVIVLVVTQKDLRHYISESMGVKKPTIVRTMPQHSTRVAQKETQF
ncbi:unnamed protein product [Toxocara canis]|uniref:G_PROTEIN_RECEP_F1_2 domain-containing protein n=1 Tax=Toxocara canis TaxID=6265 RepID=A0A183VEN0_TOXCA|nr:unnamed protein product [Toxocara canis]